MKKKGTGDRGQGTGDSRRVASSGCGSNASSKIQACDAFNFETGNESIIVAIADTGVRYFHKDLGGAGAFYKANADPNQNPFTPEERALLDGNVWFNLAEKTGSNIVDDDGNGKINDWVGWDFVGEASTFPYAPYPGEDGSVEDNDPRDFNGHGTHCAGIVAAMTNNDRDLASVAGGWGSGSADDTHGNGVKTMPLRIGWSAAYFGFMEVGLVRMDYAARALSYAADKGAKIVSCSWGSSNSGGLGAAVDYFLASGGLIFKAAGNSNNQTADYLCSRSDVISVAATDQNDAKASFSSYGAWVDISAPGLNIWSLYHGHGPLLDPAVDYVESLSGTSMATPLPETSWNANVNYVKKMYTRNNTYIGLDLSAFYTYFRNRIIPDYETDPNKIIYSNLDGSAVSKGISMNLDVSWESGFKILAGGTLMDVSITENGITTRQLLTERFSGVWNIGYTFGRSGLSIDYTGNLYGPMRLPLLGELDNRAPYSPWWSVQNIQLTKTLGRGWEIYDGIKNLRKYTPPANSIARPFDPFDKNVQFDGNGQVVPTPDNPNALTFDPNYVFAPNQGIRGFLGVRYFLNR